ncbi:hypothetical protein GUJ93_ZPchr0012g19294 [Zizania palustris]|uniref:Uncharacterized protein n=1 Tax=Zizania palustris TaxID=103762 RepID=A0A8J5WQH5_ZIZPA|nr:hypothetical protein GUJ93_ZPchr0012g19294 [Zizania palustris]
MAKGTSHRATREGGGRTLAEPTTTMEAARGSRRHATGEVGAGIPFGPAMMTATRGILSRVAREGGGGTFADTTTTAATIGIHRRASMEGYTRTISGMKTRTNTTRAAIHSENKFYVGLFTTKSLVLILLC